MTTIQSHKANTQAERIPVFCEKAKKLLTRIDAASVAQLAEVQGGMWCWCKGCHMEHHILWSTIATPDKDKQL